MAWKETCVMDERTEFIVAWKRGLLPMTALCEAHGISRKTGYKWRDRYLAFGWDGLVDVSRARHELGHTMGAEIAAAVIALRQKHPLLGPRKLKQVLERDCPDFAWPAASTIGDLLRREGLSEARRRRRRAVPVTQPFAEARLPNDLWCIDFKGWFRTRDGQRCDPLTVSDAVSRYVLACRIVAPTLAGVRPACEQLFRERGLPLRMRMDNGPPFASIGPAGLSQLSVWWLKLGIGLERIDPGAPQQNARHERMHGTLQKHTARPPAETRSEQQARFDEFIPFFNEFRPHEALGQETPVSRYRPSTRPFPERLEEPWYDAEHAVRRVRPTGEIKWGGDLVFVSEALAGEPIGIADTADGDWLQRRGEPHPLSGE
jgi:putative transposase